MGASIHDFCHRFYFLFKRVVPVVCFSFTWELAYMTFVIDSVFFLSESFTCGIHYSALELAYSDSFAHTQSYPYPSTNRASRVTRPPLSLARSAAVLPDPLSHHLPCGRLQPYQTTTHSGWKGNSLCRHHADTSAAHRSSSREH